MRSAATSGPRERGARRAEAPWGPEPMRRLIKLSIFSVALVAIGFVFLISASVHTFSALTDETLIAEVEFERVASQQYVARLRTGCEDLELPVYGDQWRIDAEFLKWKYWAVVLGLDSQYRLDRFEGRYRGAAEQNARPTLAHDLGRRNVVDIVGLSESLGPLNMLVDASYGSSTYRDIDTASVHRVYKTPTGILTRSEARRPARADGDALPIEISQACGDEPGYWQRASQWVDAAVSGALSLVAG